MYPSSQYNLSRIPSSGSIVGAPDGGAVGTGVMVGDRLVEGERDGTSEGTSDGISEGADVGLLDTEGGNVG